MKKRYIKVIPSALKKWNWSSFSFKRLEDICDIIYGLRQFWPLSVRQVYYRVISLDGLNEMDHWKSQKPGHRGEDIKKMIDAVGEIVKWGRIDGEISWAAINDEGRQVSQKAGHSSPGDFIKEEIDWFLQGYNLCTAQYSENNKASHKNLEAGR
jgi:hypothetical protein